MEVLHKGQFFHWVANRALNHLVAERFVGFERRELAFGGKIKWVWKKTFRYPKRAEAELLKLVSRYAEPSISEGLGHQGEILVLEGFARNGFQIVSRNSRQHEEACWSASEHDLDLIVRKDGIGYGVEIKNTLPYIDRHDFEKKVEISRHLGLVPVMAARMMPKTWINELQAQGGFSLILQDRFYPWGQKALAQEVSAVLGLPVRCVTAIEQGAFDRFETWRAKHVK